MNDPAHMTPDEFGAPAMRSSSASPATWRRSRAIPCSRRQSRVRCGRGCRGPRPSTVSLSPTCCATSTRSSCPESPTGSRRASLRTSRRMPRAPRYSGTFSPPASGSRACCGRPAPPAPSSRRTCWTGSSTCSICPNGSAPPRRAAGSSRTPRRAVLWRRCSRLGNAQAPARSTSTGWGSARGPAGDRGSPCTPRATRTPRSRRR